MPPKANPTTDPPLATSSNFSGKLLIIGILTIAFLAAGTSWWFRFSATHRVATFWGPAAVVIRDARVVELWLPANPHEIVRSASLSVNNSDLHDISSAHGLVHLRNALLEDHSFNWPPIEVTPDVQWTQGLRFLDGSTGVLVMFSRDFKFVRAANGHEMLSCEPMADGLREMFAEFSAAATIAPPGLPEQGPAGQIEPANPAR
jgi:hypothetical protein